MPKNIKSIVLVFIQLFAIGYLFFSGPLIPEDPFVFIIFIAGVFLAIWSLYAFRTTKFNLLPEIPENAALVTSGPYRLIRHPMYTSILLIATSLLISDPLPSRMLVFVVLVGVVLYKTHMEEKYLDRHFKEYGNYKAQTQKLVPFLY